ncbi:MAG TPA: beta-ketoacyl synthase N-terminal-like domain-containing protein, partial [Candidatus Xenobia bacterium]
RHPELFDAGFFGISPREATAMDPQQRILLEVAWEALEDAGYPLEQVSGTNMGVFTGISVHDYADLQDIDSLSTHSVSGWALCMASNRISYAFDFRGPSFSVDTACSSALVALHQACLAIDKGECDGALVCGSNSLYHPMHHIAFSRLSMLSPTSRCHAFDKSADGYVRSEGAGVVVLKPLQRAVADGDRIYAVLRRTAVNSDGRNEGLTVPNVEAQIRLLQTAYRDMPIEKVRYVEAHGTGTQVGDPVEARAIGEVLGRRDRPVLVGSVKTNIGHLEAGAGIAGLIKACLVAWKRQVPPNLHFHEPNPKIPFDDLGLVIPTQSHALPEDSLLGVNSFGFGGTNGHAVLSTHPQPVASRPSNQPYLICLSARSEAALQTRREHLQALPAQAVAYTALARRSHLPYRMAFLSDDPAPPAPQHVRHRPRIAFVYSGQGSQWVGMGRSLLADSHFAACIEACEPHFKKSAGWSLKAALHDDALRLEETRLAQPLIFAIQAGLTWMLRAWGIEAEAVIGHSVGEVAAAWASGHLSLADAIHLVVHRGRLMDCDASHGRMLAVAASPDKVAPYLSDGVGVAAINAPASVTLSGTIKAIDKIRQRLRDSGFDCTDVRVEYAFHSAQLDGLQGELLAALASLQPQASHCPMISTVTGVAVSRADAAYWWQNVRQAVHFTDAVKTARDQGIDTFIEVGGHPVLGPALVDNGVRTVPTLRRQQPERRAFLAALAELYRLGAHVQWGDAERPQWIRWPRYPWQHERFWQESQRCAALRTDPSRHALLGQPSGMNAWTLSVSPEDPSWMGHHLLHQQCVLSASTVLEMGLEAAHATGRPMPLVLEKVHIDAACYITPGTVLNVLSDGSTFTVMHDGKPLAGGQVSTGTEGHRTLDVQALQARFERVNEGSLKAEFDARGLQFGPTFDAMQRVWSHRGEALAEIVGEAHLPAHDGLSFTHPGTIDSCFQALLATTDQTMTPPGTTFMPVGMERVRLLHPFEGRVFVHVRLRHQTRREVLVDLGLHSPDGRLLMEVQGYRLVRALERTGAHPLDTLGYAMAWEPSDITEREDRSGAWLVFSDGSPFADRLAARLDEVHVMKPGARYDLRDVQPLAGCIHLQALSATREDAAAPLLPLIDLLVQAEEHDLPVPRLWAVSKWAQPVTGNVNPDGAPLWGLVRVLATEEPYLNPTLIDIDSDDVEPVLAELTAKAAEEVAYRNGRRFVHRCGRLALTGLPLAAAPAESRYALTCDPPGTLEALCWEAQRPGPLASDHVRVDAMAAGLNFSDVMRALGLYPTEGLLGVEFAGRVLEVGSNVADLAPGDRVMGLGAGTFATTVDVPRHYVVRTPDALSDTEAAALPLAFATSYHALLDTGRLRPGERVLIHAATGGVGQAAMQVARNVGAEIYATAGSEEKRKLLLEQGVAEVYDSRTTDFADQVQVDVVLNSLSGEGLVRGLDTLRRFGRFVDLTKRDIYADMPVGLNPFRRGLSYTAVDLEQVMHHAPEIIQRLLVRLRDDILAGRVKPLPTMTWPYDRVEDAFRTMSQARHIGKVVLVRSKPERVQRSAHPLTPGRWLVTGGLGGFGSEVV